MRVLNVKALVGTFNQEKALVVAFSVITSLCVDLRFKLYFVTLLLPCTWLPWSSDCCCHHKYRVSPH